ncbi:hypothetical protein, conserved [Trypanosoma brucei gambiense DAL972]|uniref:N-acetyltransferase domain-containing protein n=1 Tax=Trypanosoma brucei gambiense (strain MHOM/CI/86/DAL972) TaxID=679716 RepID=D0A794_TRYB9|nr:hypothetical protein, conserved [Trypanosoma brucei gambiense DAL972]CBH17545.1 hypothetical protein, conserved [Trypanosoma brucei gambiense DAL972]|eukprot:XP_011779809.1 hypothetical protein, conserved [Trypanosoma brucei gambiense DAL972]
MSTSLTSSSTNAVGRGRRVTRSLVGANTTGGGVLRCVCTAYLVSVQETLLECCRCRNWCHPACVGVDHAELRRYYADNNYVCPFCRGMQKRERGESRAPAPRQTPLRLREVPDRAPFGFVTQLRNLLKVTTRAAQQAGYTIIDLPSTPLTEVMERQCLECCAEAIKEATFSEQYPLYCLKEVWTRAHPYMQGTLLRCSESGRIVSMVLSNGMDVYGNLRPTITQLKSGINRGIIDRKHQTAFMAACTKLDDVSDFVHITLSATHKDYQRRGLARMLMALDLLKWALRGRTRAYLNMALEKKVVDGGARLECVASPSSRRLYESFGFRDVYPRFDRETDEQRWTPKEADMGRVMAHLNFVEDLVIIASRYDPSGKKAAAPNQSSIANDGSASVAAAADRAERVAANSNSGQAATQAQTPAGRRLSLFGKKS